MQMIQDGSGEGGALSRVSSGSKLVKKDKGTLIYMFQEGNDVGHMGRKGAQALLDALLVTDICVYVMEYGELRAVQCRDV